jgi:hypothetical protein
MKNIFIFILSFLPILLSAQPYEVGDTARGGIVFFVSENGDTALVCGMHNASSFSDWETAKSRCENSFGIQDGKLLRGWRMPTLREMKIIRTNRDALNKFIDERGATALESDVGSYYWTITEGKYSSRAYLQAFGFDHAVLMNKDSNTFTSRAVKTVLVK